MFKMDAVSKIFVFYIICILNADSKYLSQREKRFVLQSVTDNVQFPTPTTFPVPTIRNKQTLDLSTLLQSIFTGSFLLNSIKVQCPHKRSAAYHRVLLDDNIMQELYLKLVGNIDQSIQGRSLEDATNNFKHILTLPTNKSLNNHHHHHRGKKSEFISDLKKFQSWYGSVMEHVKNKSDRNDTLAAASYDSEDNIDDVLKKIDITKAQLKQILGLVHDIDEITGFQLSNKRTRRHTIGALQSRTEYCHRRGAPNGNAYVHMCSACALTTQFPEDMFPRYTNEITCDDSDCDCFSVQNTAHGKCQPIMKNVQMLKRNDGCRMFIKNGQQIVIDDWEIYEQPLHVGCECMFKKNSLFSRFIPKQ